VLEKMDHPCVISLCAAFQTAEELVLVTPYLSGGDLYGLLERHPEHCLAEHATVFCAGQLILALGYLHENGVVFRDVKPENIILDKAGHAKLCDFGFVKEFSLTTSKEGGGVRGRCASVVGTAEYMAPEVVQADRRDPRSWYGVEADWWSLGVVLLEMTMGLGKTPFTADEMEETFSKIVKAEVTIPAEACSPQAASLIQGLLTKDPAKRLGSLGSIEIQDHEFFASLDWSRLAAGDLPAPEELQLPQLPPEMKPLPEAAAEGGDEYDEFADFETYLAPPDRMRAGGEKPSQAGAPREAARDTCTSVCGTTARAEGSGRSCAVQ